VGGVGCLHKKGATCKCAKQWRTLVDYRIGGYPVRLRHRVILCPARFVLTFGKKMWIDEKVRTARRVGQRAGTLATQGTRYLPLPTYVHTTGPATCFSASPSTLAAEEDHPPAVGSSPIQSPKEGA